MMTIRLEKSSYVRNENEFNNVHQPFMINSWPADAGAPSTDMI